MCPSHQSLLQVAIRLAGTSQADTERLAACMLPIGDESSWDSTLNNDGSPLQVGVTWNGGPSPSAVRLIVDPAAGMARSARRRQRAEEVLRQITASHGPTMRPLCDSVLTQMLPADADTQAALPGAGVWIAADLSGSGLAVYVTTKWGSHAERWERARHWLGHILPEPSAAGEILNRLSTHAVLVSAGAEGGVGEKGYVKLYWRLEASTPLAALGIPLFDSPAAAQFLELVIEDRRFPRKAILASVSFHASSGRLHGVKLDICGHCIQRAPADWLRILRACSVGAERNGTSSSGYPELFDKAELAFIGLGLDREAKPRLNVYLKRLAPAEASVAARAGSRPPTD